MQYQLEFPLTPKVKEKIEIDSIAWMPKELAGRVQGLINNAFSQFSKTRFQNAGDVEKVVDNILKLIQEQKDDLDWFNTYRDK